MTQYKVAILGCGGRGRGHAEGFAASPDVVLVACADPLVANATTLAAQRKILYVYNDYRRLLREQRPDVVSICTWPALHCEMVMAAVEAGARAILCEKPMAPTWAESKRMHEVCVKQGVLLAFCHQRRFGAPFNQARQWIQNGAIGQLARMEGFCPNLFDWGTHWFDMFFYYNNEQPAESVLGQIDCDEEHTVFGAPVESNGVSFIRWKNGVHGLLLTGDSGEKIAQRLIGTEGLIELGWAEGRPLRLWRKGKPDWETINLADARAYQNDTTAAVLDVLAWLKTGKKSRLASDYALAATELIFATYESARRRQKITLPLDVDDASLVAMLARSDVKWRRPPTPKKK